MKCLKCKRLLVEFSEGRLRDELHQEIMEHISGCDACRRELERLQSSLRLMDDAKETEEIPEPPDDFVDQVMNLTGQDDRNHSPARRLAFGITIGCCLLGLALFFYGGFWERQTPTSNNTAVVKIETPDISASPSLDHVKRELVRLLDQTLEAIERGEQEWEIEI